MDEQSKIVLIAAELGESAEVARRTADMLSARIVEAAALLVERLRSGKKILVFGNGGSAADAQHLVAELVVRFEFERAAMAAVALTTDSSIMTAAANDYGYERVFARQIEALGAPGDVVVAISTSGASPNILAGVQSALDRGCAVLVLTGEGGDKLAEMADVALTAPSRRTSRIQEAHGILIHALCRLVEAEMAGP